MIIVTEGTLSDRGFVPEELYETMDFSFPEGGESIVARWTEIEFEAWGTEVEVSVSVNKGRQFGEVQTITLTESPEWYKVPIDLSGRTLRVRFFSATKNFTLRNVRIWSRAGGVA